MDATRVVPVAHALPSEIFQGPLHGLEVQQIVQLLSGFDGQLSVRELPSQGEDGAAEVLELFLSLQLYAAHKLADLFLNALAIIITGLGQLLFKLEGFSADLGILDGATAHDDPRRVHLLSQANVTAA